MAAEQPNPLLLGRRAAPDTPRHHLLLLCCCCWDQLKAEPKKKSHAMAFPGPDRLVRHEPVGRSLSSRRALFLLSPLLGDTTTTTTTRPLGRGWRRWRWSRLGNGHPIARRREEWFALERESHHAHIHPIVVLGAPPLPPSIHPIPSTWGSRRGLVRSVNPTCGGGDACVQEEEAED